MTTLVSFLGGGKKKEKTEGYFATCYQFDDGEISDKSKYFGLTLAQKINAKRLILLGTSGSIWDVFFESGLEEFEDKWSELSDAVEKNSVTKEHLREFEGILSKRLSAEFGWDIKVDCYLIDYAKDEKGQVEILRQLADVLPEGSHLNIDVTHGFRHLPMIALVASRYLKTVKKITVNQIYYGSYVPEKKISEVIELSGLLTMLDWVSAIETFDKDGDYAVFADLLERVGLDSTSASELKRASFLERVINASDASQKLKQVAPKLEKLKDNSSPLFELFSQPLQIRLDWFRKSSLGLQEQDLANKYLKRQDYLRAIIYAMEGLISRETELAEVDVHDYKERKQYYDALINANDKFRMFKEFRNSMVHGTASGKQNIRNMMKEQQSLEDSLKSRFKNLFK